MQDAPAHKDPYNCSPCQLSFPIAEPLNKHLQTSSAHAASHTCTLCDRSFTSNGSLSQHLQTSSKHTSSSTYSISNHSFKTEDALEQHSQNSLAHSRPSHPCPHYTRTFASAAALAQHTRDYPAYASTPRDTPLDAFFYEYHDAVGFTYDRTRGPAMLHDGQPPTLSFLGL